MYTCWVLQAVPGLSLKPVSHWHRNEVFNCASGLCWNSLHGMYAGIGLHQSSCWGLENGSSPEDCWAQEQAPPGVVMAPNWQSSRGIWSILSEVVFEFWVVLWSSELDLKILVSPSQLRLFHDSTFIFLIWISKQVCFCYFANIN